MIAGFGRAATHIFHSAAATAGRRCTCAAVQLFAAGLPDFAAILSELSAGQVLTATLISDPVSAAHSWQTTLAAVERSATAVARQATFGAQTRTCFGFTRF